MPDIKPTFDIIDGRVNKLTKGLDKVEIQLFKKLQQLILEFESKDGKFVANESAFKVLGKIKSSLAQMVKDSQYSKQVGKFVDSFDEINENIKGIHKQVNNLSISNSLLSKEKAGFVNATLLTLNDAQVNSQFIEPVRRALLQRITLGTGVGETLDVMRDMVLGTDDKKGVLTRWSGQVARDALGQYQGQVNAKILDEYDLKGYLYVGTLVDDSRAQCAKWLHKGFIPKEELQKEITWALKGGVYQGENAKGMNRSTTPSTFAVFRGGYNCRHEAIPSDGPLEASEENNIDYAKRIAKDSTLSKREKKELVYEIDEDNQYETLHEFKNGGKLKVHVLASIDPNYKKELVPSRILAENGYDVEMLPEIHHNDKAFRRKLLKGYSHHSRNPDLRVNGEYYDIKEPEKFNRKALKSIVRNVKGQASKAVIYMKNKNVDAKMIAETQFKNSKSLDEIFFVFKDGEIQRFKN